MSGIGVTATREGCTTRQLVSAKFVMEELACRGLNEFHHGDCVGGDASLAGIATAMELKVVAHPPSNPIHRAYVESHIVLPMKDYLVRNKDIVAVCDFLIACPSGTPKSSRRVGGTWRTIRMAEQLRRDHIIIWGDGQVDHHIYAVSIDEIVAIG